MHKKNWKKQEKITEGSLEWISSELSRVSDSRRN